uniref:Sterile alpha motif domain-containing protein 3 n=1 Tax=Gouania willdenowi TaxID=441366 RepID=A0A8C5NAK4_GOUWI
MNTYKIRIVLNADGVRKMTLEKRPQTLEELQQKVKEKCTITEDFHLMYEDPDFNNQLCNLENIEDLPQERATLKVIPLVTICLQPVPFRNEDLESDDTDLVSLNSSSSSSRSEQWPEFFDIPKFPSDVEFRLHKANMQYLKDGTPLDLPSDMKVAINAKLAEAIFKYDAYPSVDRFKSVAKALISKHPCLTEPGSPDGCSGWVNSLTFKMSNYRQKLRKSGCFEVEVNSKNLLPSKKHAGLKRAKRSEVNFLPNLPNGSTEEKLEEERKELIEEMKKRNPSDPVIKAKMNMTFPLRRQEIVNSATPVKEVQACWPALFTEKQVNAEFYRITTTNLESDFYQTLDRYTPQLIKIFKSKKGTSRDKLATIIHDITKIRTLVLRGISVILGEDSSKFYLSCRKDNEDVWRDVSVGILLVTDDGPTTDEDLHLSPLSSSLIVEGGIVLDDMKSLPQALLLVFGLIYSLNLEYPKPMKNTLNFIQMVILGLGGNKLPPKLQALKNRLSY